VSGKKSLIFSKNLGIIQNEHDLSGAKKMRVLAGWHNIWGYKVKILLPRDRLSFCNLSDIQGKRYRRSIVWMLHGARRNQFRIFKNKYHNCYGE